ncbi:MAG: hypothetical protein HY962_09985 [Ignavibacteriae bacterium]|nr:hypothetical protein [Ignavibacteriota bacterium]
MVVGSAAGGGRRQEIGGLQPGVYFLRLSARLNDGRVVQTTRKMTVLR